MQKAYKYFRRLFKVRQMDFEFAFWQMLQLMVAPSKVYRNFRYHNETKHQWARDDPAFLVLLSLYLCISSVGFTIALHLGFFGFWKFLLWVVLFDCIGVGVLVATLLWLISNHFLLNKRHIESSPVEWAYCFDVHLNALFPLLLILHGVQLLLFGVLDQPYFLSLFLSNSLWFVAAIYYIYITFLGYSALPGMHRTVLILYTAVPVGIAYLLSLILQWNFATALKHFYQMRL
ncbi:protein unc-50 homolog isoform X2 [Dysidea avara]